MWATYNGLQAPAHLPGTINHILKFADPQIKVPTNDVEAQCGAEPNQSSNQ